MHKPSPVPYPGEHLHAVAEVRFGGRAMCRPARKNAIVRAMTFANPSPEEICQMLRSIHTIAVVGLSSNPERPSFRVASAMQSHGYRIVPVVGARHGAQELLGEVAYANLEDIPFPVDMVDVFRASEYVPAIVESCIALGIQRLWLQEGVIHEAAAQHARDAGLTVVMNQCMWRDYSRLCGQTP